MKKINICILIGMIIFQSCISIKHSSHRIPEPERIEIGNSRISLTGAVYLNMFGIIKADFIPASIKMEFDDKYIYVDPLVIDDTSKADYVFITHNHLDHFSKCDIKKLLQNETILIGPKTVTRKIKSNKTVTVSLGDIKNLGNIKYEVVESYNVKSNIHKKGSNYVGYVISLDSARIYIAGDTDSIPEMGNLKNITVAFVPIGEGKTAMNPQMAASAINLIKPKMTIPVHYKLGQNSGQDFLKLVDKNIEVKLIE